MTRAFPILLMLCLTACGSLSIRLAPSARVPIPPEMGEQVSKPCPPANQLSDPLIATLAKEDGDLAVLYAECKARKEASDKAYADTRASLIKFKADLEAEEAAAKK